MKLQTRTVKVTSGGTADTGTVLCGLAGGAAAAHLMRLLSDLYPDSAAAVLREYSVNARDAHIAAGNPDPIEVTLPSELNPVLVITDHGTGLSKNELLTVYAPYGASTKRDSNSQTGAFGLGSKSAFTLSQQFIVTAVKGRELTVAAFGLDESGAGSVTILDHRETDKPDGVTVSIPIGDVSAVCRAAGPVFAGWKPGTVLVNGEQPPSVFDAPEKITEDVLLSGDPEGSDAPWGGAGLIIIMGGICYPVTGSLRDALGHREPAGHNWTALLYRQQRTQRVFAVVGIGDVDIAPSREVMRDTPRSIARLEQVAASYDNGIGAVAQRMLDAAPTRTAAARKISTMRHDAHLSGPLGNLKNLTWRGQQLPYEVKVPFTSASWPRTWPSKKNVEHEPGSFALHLDSSGLDKTLVITGVPQDRETAASRGAKAFLSGDRIYERLVFTPPGAQPAGWFAFGGPDALPVLPLDEYLAEVKRRRPAPEKNKDGVQYKVFTERPRDLKHGGRKMTIGEITRLDLPVVVAGHVEELSEGAMQFESFASAVHEGHAVIALSGSQTRASLSRKLGGQAAACTLSERADAVAAGVAASWTGADRELLRVRACQEAGGNWFSPQLLELRGRITNPDAAGVLDRMARYENLTRGECLRGDLVAGAQNRWPTLFPDAEKKRNLVKEYPLLESVQYRRLTASQADHVVAYLNAFA